MPSARNARTPPTPSTIGATVVATGSDGDFTLLTLDQDTVIV